MPPPVFLLHPLAVGAVAAILTILVHALALSATVNVVRREKRLRRMGASFGIDFGIVTAVTALAFAAHLLEIALWAAVFMLCGEFPSFGLAFDHSAVNYTTLGYGNVIMSPRWRLLGPLEAANGMLMFGLSTALIFAVIEALIRARFADLRT